MAKNISDYIRSTPKLGQKKLREIYRVLKKAAPKAKETIKWRVPVFMEKRILFAFAGFKNHINFMPTPSVIRAYKKDLASYKTGKGSIQFPYDKPLPKGLIKKMAARRLKEAWEKDARWM